MCLSMKNYSNLHWNLRKSMSCTTCFFDGAVGSCCLCSYYVYHRKQNTKFNSFNIYKIHNMKKTQDKYHKSELLAWEIT